MKPTYISFASGWGGTSSGFKQARWQGKLAIDIDPTARKYHLLNFPDTTVKPWDLSKVSPDQIREVAGDVDFVLNTCPCTKISAAGVPDPYHPLNAMLLRTVGMLPHLGPNIKGMLVENVPNLKVGKMKILYELLKQEYSKLKDFQWIDGVWSSIHYNTPQQRKRYCAIILHRDFPKPIFPAPTTKDYEALMLKNIAPEVKLLKTGYTDEYKRHDKLKPRTPEEYCFTATATVNLFDQNDVPIDIPTLLRLCGYPADWIYSIDPKDYVKMYRLCGNSVMPPFSKAIGEAIKIMIGM